MPRIDISSIVLKYIVDIFNNNALPQGSEENLRNVASNFCTKMKEAVKNFVKSKLTGDVLSNTLEGIDNNFDCSLGSNENNVIALYAVSVVPLLTEVLQRVLEEIIEKITDDYERKLVFSDVSDGRIQNMYYKIEGGRGKICFQILYNNTTFEDCITLQ